MALDRADGLNSLGFAKAPQDTRVVVAMSGGVDSSVVAAMLAEEGYDVVGVTLQLYDHGAALAKKGACCAGRDIHDAARVAERIIVVMNGAATGPFQTREVLADPPEGLRAYLGTGWQTRDL